jgi:hypothetical protein
VTQTDCIVSSATTRPLFCGSCEACPFRNESPVCPDGTMLNPGQTRFLAAMVYAAWGYAVYPCSAESPAQARYIPNGPRGGGQDLATVDMKQIQSKKWIEAWHRSDTNIGIRTGLASRLVVIDLDHDKTPRLDASLLTSKSITVGELDGYNQHGTDCCGAHELEKWEAEKGITVPREAIVRTPGDGQHIWLLLPLDWEKRVQKRIGWLKRVDLLWDDHMIKAPPSVRADTANKNGGSYQFTQGCPCQAPIASAGLLDAIVGTPSARPEQSESSGGRGGSVDIELYLREGIPMGRQGDELWRVVCSLAFSGHDEQHILQILCDIVQMSDQDKRRPWTGKDLAKLALRGAQRGRDRSQREQAEAAVTTDWARQLTSRGGNA